MANVFKPKRSSVGSSVPTISDLTDGELAVNSADQKIYLRDGSTVIEVANVSSSGSSGTVSSLGIIASGHFSSTGSTVYADGISCSRTSTGVFAITFSSALSNTNYSISGQIIEGSNRDDIKIHVVDSTKSTTGFTLNVYEGDNGTTADAYVDRGFFVTIIGTVQYPSTIWTTDGTDAYRTTGDVGIGTDNPTAKLDVRGDISLTGTVDGRDVATDGTKLDGIEASADVTDATNVDAAGAVMNNDTSTSGMSFVIDEDNMTSDSATKVPTQQSVKAYVDANAGGSTPTLQDVTDEGSTTTNSMQAASIQLLNGTDIFPENSTFDRLVVQNSTSGQGATVQIVGPTNGVSEIGFSDSSRNQGLLSYSHVNNSMNFDANGANRVTILSNGNVGVNSSSPSEQLDIDGNCKATAFIGDGSQLTGISGGGISNYAKYVGTGTPNLNSSTTYGEVSWINTTPQFSNGTWSATSEHVVVPNNGIYLVQVNFYITASVVRSNIGLKFAVNDTQQTEIAAHNYIRNASGHSESSINMATTLSLSANDQVSIYVARLANSGTVSLQGTSSTLAITQLA